jgi:myosin heavy subunit
MIQSLKLEEKQFRLGSTLILLKREVVDEMERKRGLLLVRHALVLQNLVRTYMSKSVYEIKRNLRQNLQSVLRLQSVMLRSIAHNKYADMLGVVIQVKARMSIQEGDSNVPQNNQTEPIPPISEISEVNQVCKNL